MAFVRTSAPELRAVVTCTPGRRFDNVNDTTEFTEDEVRKVVAMAGVVVGFEEDALPVVACLNDVVR